MKRSACLLVAALLAPPCLAGDPGAPAEAPGADEQVALNRAIVEVLAARRIPAVGFVNEVRLERDGAVDPARVRALELWLEADLETKQAFEAFLSEHGYRVAPVTIDNSEWIFARAYLNASRQGDAAERQRIADEYVAYMERKVEYFERQSVALFEREIPQVLLVHANRLNAEQFDRIAAMLAGRGYRFVPLEQALADEAYATRDTFTGRGGITWLHRWALSTDRRDRIVPDEPRTARFVLDAAGIESE